MLRGRRCPCGGNAARLPTLSSEGTSGRTPYHKRPQRVPTVLGQEEVHDLIQGAAPPKHRAVLLTLYRLLFRSAAWALQQSLREECGRPAASTMVLHTWNQRLGHHPHLQALVPDSGQNNQHHGHHRGSSAGRVLASPSCPVAFAPAGMWRVKTNWRCIRIGGPNSVQPAKRLRSTPNLSLRVSTPG